MHALGVRGAPSHGTPESRKAFVPQPYCKADIYVPPSTLLHSAPFMGMDEATRAFPPHAVTAVPRRHVIPANAAGRMAGGSVLLREAPFIDMGTSYAVGVGAVVEDDVASVDSRGYAY